MRHPQIEILHDLYQKETQPFRKVHRMIDLFECILKSHTAVIISSYFNENKLSDAVKGLLADGLRTPSLGTWQLFSRIIQAELTSAHVPSFMPSFQKEFEWLDKSLNEEKTNIISFRNGYAHGATPTDEQCNTDITKFSPFLEKLLNLSWQKESSIELQNGKVILIRMNDNASLSLYPILVTREEQGQQEIAFFNDLNKEKIGLLNYSLSKHYKEKDFYPVFTSHFPVKEWKTTTTSEFKQRIDELTESFKGRVIEREQIHQWLHPHQKGFLCVTGNPGIGKSALIARVFKELNRDEYRGQYYLIEYFIRRGTRQSKPENLLDYLLKSVDKLFKNTINPASQGLTDKQTALFEKLAAFGEIENSQKLLIMIDGLDEGVEENLLEYLPRQTFNKVLVIYGSRPGGDDRLQRFWTDLPVEHKKFLELSGLNKNDIRALLYDVANKYELQPEWVDLITDRSQGNPLYLKLLCTSIEEGQIVMNDAKALPKGIDDFYKEFLDRFSRMTHGDALLQALYLFASAKDYLTQHHLELIAAMGEATAQRVISTLSEVLYENPITTEVLDYQLFHESFREYLQSTRASQLRDAEKKIVLFGSQWQRHKGKFEQLYALRHQTTHLAHLSEKEPSFNEQLLELANDEAYQAEQKKTLKSYTATKQLLSEALRIACEQSNTEAAIHFALDLIKLHHEEQNSFREVFSMLEDGDIDNALQRITNFGGASKEQTKKQFILYMLCLQELTLGSLNKLQHKKETIQRLLQHLDETVTSDHSLLNWDDFYPSNLMFLIAVEIKRLDLEHVLLWMRTDTWDSGFIKKTADIEAIGFEVLKEAAGQIKYEYIKSSVISNIAASLAVMGKLEEATKTIEEAINIAAKITKGYNKFTALSAIAEDFAKMGKVEDALSCAMQITDNVYKSSAFSNIAVSLVGIGKEEEAQMVIREALSCAAQITDNNEKSSKFSIIAVNLAEIGKNEEAQMAIREALSCLKQITYYSLKSSIFQNIARSLFKMGKVEDATNSIEEALNIATKITDDVTRFHTLKEIAMSLAGMGKIEQAEKTLGDAINCAVQVTFEDLKFSAIKDIAGSLTIIGKLEYALNIASQITDSESKLAAFSEIAMRLAIMGKVKDAEKVFRDALSLSEQITGIESKSSAFLEIAVSLGRIGKVIEAMNIAAQISDNAKKTSAFIDIAGIIAEMGKVNEATKALDEAQSITLGRKDSSKSYAFMDIAVRLAKMGKIEDALSITTQITEENIKSHAIIAVSLAGIGKLDDVTKVIENAINIAIQMTGNLKSFALKDIAVAIAKKGNVKDALNCAALINSDIIRSTALNEIVEGLSVIGKVEESLQVVAVALRNAEQIKSEGEKATAFNNIAVSLAEIGKIEEATKAIEEALNSVAMITEDWEIFLKLNGIARSMVKMEKISEAIAIAKQRIDGRHRIDIFSSIAEVQISKSSLEQCIKLLTILPNQEAKDAWLGGLVSSLKYNETNPSVLLPLLAACRNLPKYIEDILMHMAAYFCFFDERPNRKLIGEMAKVLDIQHYVTCLPAESTNTYQNIEDWIKSITDEDDLEQVQLWAKKVQKGTMSEQDYEIKVKEILK